MSWKADLIEWLVEMAIRRILVLTPRFPFPAISGDLLRIYGLCLALSKRCELTLLSFTDCKLSADFTYPETKIFQSIHIVYLPKWQSYWNVIKTLFSSKPLQLGYYKSNKFANKVSDLLKNHDIVLAHLIRTGQYIENLHSKCTVLEMTDFLTLMYEKSQEYSSFSFKSLLYKYIEHKRIAKYELETIRKFNLVSLVSERDINALAKRVSRIENVKVYTLGTNIVDQKYIGPGNKPVIVFVGQMRYLPNVDACEYFLEEIFPIVRHQIPSVIFRIIGTISDGLRKRFLKIPNVEVTGRVESITTAVSEAFAAVCPIRIGAGIQNKVLTYMALGLPTVATDLAHGSMNCIADKDILVADDAQGFADKIVELYNNPDLRLQLSKNGREYVENKHDWNKITDKFVEDVIRLYHTRGDKL